MKNNHIGPEDSGFESQKNTKQISNIGDTSISNSSNDLEREVTRSSENSSKKRSTKNDDALKNFKPALSLEIFSDFLKEAGITIRNNLITNKIEVSGLPAPLSASSALITLPTFCRNRLKKTYSNCTKNDIEDFIFYIADVKRYNPVEDMLKSGKWDRQTRLSVIFEILNVNDSFSKMLITKWFHQTIAMALNNESKPWGADGVLVLQGAQGDGKTRFFSILSLESSWFVEGASINLDVKDTIIKATGRWITELGELDGTLKREQEALKAFITASSDTIRAPFQRSDVTRPRRTSFCGTVNPDHYLRDETGSRRFWTIPIKSIDLKRLEGLQKDWIIQLWLEVYQMFLKEQQGFRLTYEERQKLLNINSVFNKPLMYEQEIRDLLDYEDENAMHWDWLNSTAIISQVAVNITAEQFGKIFKKLQSENSKLQVTKNRAGKLYYLPLKKY